MNTIGKLAIKLIGSFLTDNEPIVNPQEKLEQDINSRVAFISMILKKSQNYDEPLLSRLKFRLKLIHNESFLSAYASILDCAFKNNNNEFKAWASEHLVILTELKCHKEPFQVEINYNHDLSTDEWESKKLNYINKIVTYLQLIENQSKTLQYQKPPYSTVLSYLQTYQPLIRASFFDFPDKVTGNYFHFETTTDSEPLKLDVQTPIAVTFTFDGQNWCSKMECATEISSFYDHLEALLTMNSFLQKLHAELPNLQIPDTNVSSSASSADRQFKSFV